MSKKRKKSRSRFSKGKVQLYITGKKIRLYILYGIIGIVTLIFILFSCVYTGVFGHLPGESELKKIQNYLASEVYSADDKILGKYYIQNRTNINYSEVPEYFIDGLIATEDARFYKHNGIDKRSLLRVFFKTLLLQKESSGGGSTITQQLAKNLFPRRSYAFLTTPVNKFREMIIAVRLEKVYSKEEILEFYMNTVSFGENTYGIETASKRFFNKHPAELKIEEAALLIGMLKGTNIYNPKNQTESAIARRNIVLNQMVKYNYLAAGKADSIKKLPIKLNYTKLTHNEGIAPYFRETLRLELQEWCRKRVKSDGTRYNLYTDGLKIYTTINSDLQRYAEQSVKEHLSKVQKIFDQHWRYQDPWGTDKTIIARAIENTGRYKNLVKRGLSHQEIMEVFNTPVRMEVFKWQGVVERNMTPLDSIKHYLRFLHAGFIAMEAKTGFIRAWVGGINHKYFMYDHVRAKRQPGSTFKPVVYAAALEQGYDPCNYIPNDSVVFEDYNNWTPRNSNREYGGYYSMKGGLTHSINTVSVNLLMETGISNVKQMAKAMGISSDLPDVPSLALGTGELSLLELVQAYNVFINKGRLVKPVYIKRIEDKDGNILYEAYPEVLGSDIMSPENAEKMIHMLRNVVNNGTASRLRTDFGFSNDIAGKTGTTQSQADGWFIGFTPDIIAGVWVGGDNPVIRFRSLAYGQGAYTALPIWGNFMKKIYRDPLYSLSKNATFNISEDLVAQMDCPDYKDEEYDSIWDYLRKRDETVIDLIKRMFRKKKNRRHRIDN